MAKKRPCGFTWVVARELAAMSRPAGADDLGFLREQGIDLIVSLTPRPLKMPLIEEFGFDYRHLPVRDFEAPTQKQIASFVRIVSRVAAKGGRVAVHCLAGKGRTGTMIACYLVAGGKTAREAIAHVRRMRPGAVETAEQAAAVRRFEERLRGKRAQRKG